MDFVVIFLPDSLKTQTSGYLVGFYQERKNLVCSSFYILDIIKSQSQLPTSSSNYQVIGTFSGTLDDCKEFPVRRKKKNWVTVKNIQGDLIVTSIVIKNIFKSDNSVQIVIYSKDPFLKSELIFEHERQNYGVDSDCFKNLSLCLKECRPEKHASFVFPLLLYFINFFLWLLSWIYEGILKVMPILKYTSSGLHIKYYVSSLIWFLQNVKQEKTLNLKTANYLVSFIIDTVSGCIVLQYLLTVWQPGEIFKFVASSAEDLVTSLFLLVEWLMGSPAGLKLNRPLNEILGGFFLYNINIWWAFLGIISPALENSFFLFLKMGLLGVTFQIAIIQDVIMLVTFHTYCIYIYAARLFGLQLSGLGSLSRVFLGRNRNPEPGRVDSFPYTMEQLFVGTISFTVLLFLLPTTMVYYVVFMMIRLGLNLVSAGLSWIIYFIQAVPVYSTYCWLCRLDCATLTVKISPRQTKANPKSLVLEARPVCGPWLTSVQLCIPEVAQTPSPFEWKDIFKKMISGSLIPPR